MVYTFIISDTVIRVNGLPLANLGQFEHEKILMIKNYNSIEQNPCINNDI